MTIVQNKKAFHDYLIEERYEAGIVLEGWEVKAIRAGRAQIKEGYVLIRAAELYLIRFGRENFYFMLLRFASSLAKLNAPVTP
jgi:tmRNA-binding protein